MYLINQQDEKKQNPPQKNLPCSLRSTPRAHTRRPPSGCKWWRCSKGSCTPANTHTEEGGERGRELFTTCGPDQHTGVHLSAGSTQIKTFRSRGVHFLSGGSFLLDFTATFETRWRCVHRVSRVLDLESDSLEGRKYKSGRFGKRYIFKKTLRLWGGSGLESSSLI